MIDPNKVIQDGEQDDTIRQSLRAEIASLREEVAKLRMTDSEREAMETAAGITGWVEESDVKYEIASFLLRQKTPREGK